MKRYRYFNCAGFQGIDEASDGDYVTYDDAKQLEQDNEALKASLSLCQEQNEEMLDMLKELLPSLRGEHMMRIDADKWVAALVAKIEPQKEGE